MSLFLVMDAKGPGGRASLTENAMRWTCRIWVLKKKLGEGAAGVTFAASEVPSGKFAEINQVSGGKSSITMAIEKIKERIF
jgi:hypothetical protein